MTTGGDAGKRHAGCWSGWVDPLIESRHLNAFVTTVRRGGVHRAGKELGLTPSAISHAIRMLEETLGVSLFERAGRRLVLSAEGKRFLPEAEDSVQRLHAMRERVRTGQNWAGRRLVIGSSPTGCRFIVPNLIREFRECFPRMALSLVEREPDELVDRLMEGTVDVGVAPLLRDYRELAQIGLAEDELGFLVHPLHPWANMHRVTRAQVAEARLILPETHSAMFEIIDSYFRQERIPTRAFIESDNEDVVKQLVGLGLGVGVLPGWIAAREISLGTLKCLPLGRRPLRRRWMVFYRKGRHLSLPETLFTGVCRAVARDLIVDNAELARDKSAIRVREKADGVRA